MTEITDGSGKGGGKMTVKGGKAQTDADTVNAVQAAAEAEDAYFCTTNVVFTTNVSAELSLAHLRNDSATREIHVDKIAFYSDQTDSVFRLYKNVTTVSAATTVAPVNSNFESGKAAEALFTAYTTAATSFTGGTLLDVVGFNPAGDHVVEGFGSIVLGNNDSITLSVFASTSARCGSNIIFHHKD